MNITLKAVFLVLATVLCFLSSVGVGSPRFNLMAAGMGFLSASFLVP
jgi:hypothetical protein